MLQNGLEEWRIVFTVGAAVYIASGIVFCIFGSGEIQPWNEIKSNTEESPHLHIPQNPQDLQQGMDNKAFVETESTNDIKDLSGNENTEVTKI